MSNAMAGSALTKMAEVLEKKDEALTSAIAYLEGFSVCDERTCETGAGYHWRGCPTNIRPLIKELLEAIAQR